MVVHIISFLYGAFTTIFLLGLAGFGVLLWLATPVHSLPYIPIPHKEKEEADKISMFSTETQEADLEEYHCGWVYLTFEYKDVPQINLIVLQEMRSERSRPGGVFFVVLNQGTLFLYDGEGQEACLGVTSLEGFMVDIWPHTLLMDEIYMKDYPLRITNPSGAILGSSSSSCFMYAANGSEKEDWLAALRKASGGTPATLEQAREQLNFPEFMSSFEARLEKQKDFDGTGQLISALLQRILFNVHKAEEIEKLIREKFIKRTESMPKVFFLGDLVLDSVDIGRAAPLLGNGRLHSVVHNEELVGSLDIDYPGGLTLQISTQVTTPVVVPIVVRVAVNRLAGRLMLKIKGPLSDRLWFGFYRIPDYDIAVEPIVSSIAITWGPIQRAIMKKIEEAMLEFVVLPNMDEIPLPPLVSGSLFLGERPFELASVPPATIDHIVARDAYTAEALSRRSPAAPSTPLEALPEGARRSVESLLVQKTKSQVDIPSTVQNRKIFVSLTERQLSSPLLASLSPSDKEDVVYQSQTRLHED